MTQNGVVIGIFVPKQTFEYLTLDNYFSLDLNYA